MTPPSAGSLAVLPDAGQVESAATAFPLVADRYDRVLDDLIAAWKRFGDPGVFEMPSTPDLLTKLQGPEAMRAVLRQQCRDVQKALSTYASALTTLHAQRAHLVSDLGDQATAEAEVQAGTPKQSAERARDEADADRALSSRAAAFNAAADAADQECARALGALSRFPLRTLQQVAQTLSQGDLSFSLSEEVLRRTRKLDVVRPGTPLPDLNPTAPSDVEFHHRVYAVRPGDPNGLLLPSTMVRDGSELQVATRPHLFLVGSESAAEHAAPTLARVGGHALGAFGVVLTYGATYADEQQQLTAEHPEWSDGKRNEEATKSTVVKGSFSWGGAAAGAAAGAALGSFLPGPGNLIGAVVGGIVGGLAGDWVGGKVDDAIEQGR